MKKIFAMVVILILLITLFSCKINQGSQGSSNGSSQNNSSVSNIQVVFNGEMGTKLQTDLFSALVYDLNLNPRFVDDTTVETENEIVIGRTNRSISSVAYRKLERVEKEKDSDVAYLIFADDNNIAIVYEEDKYGINAALLSTLNYFVEVTIPSLEQYNFSDGVIYQGTIDPIIYQKQLDQEIKEYDWMSLQAKAGTDVVQATKEYYSLFSDQLISWIADLYDPVTGGFYFSNSGRNTVGYLPDIEATFNVLSIIEGTGITDHLGGGYNNLPDWFLEKMAIWVKDMQDPNGYFYHPQWGKELTDTKLNRRSRDLRYGLSIIKAGGLSPTYDTPTGVKGDYTLSNGDVVGSVVTPSHALTGRLGVSKVSSVSKAISVASTSFASHLKDANSFKKYLNGLDLRNDSYGVGNELSNQVDQIKQRDKELGGVLVPIIKDWLYANHNASNGTWNWKSESDPSYSYYEAVNGLMKILNLLNQLGISHPSPIVAADTVIKAIYTEETPYGVVCAYNAWVAIGRIFENLEKNSTSETETKQIVSEIKEELRADAPNLIRLTAQKVALFVKEDGSSSYTAEASSATSQGMRVAVPGTNEGDTNATVLNNFGVLEEMFDIFGWTPPKMFGKADYYIFIDIIENQDPVIKDEILPSKPHDFEDYSTGEVPEWIDLEKCKSSGEKSVIKTEKSRDDGNVFMIQSIGDGNDTVYLYSENLALSSSCYAFESEFYIESEQTGYIARLYLDNCYCIGFVLNDGKISFIDTSTTSENRYEQDLGFTAPLGEWFKLRIEYYLGDAETVRIKVYLNDELKTVSDNYYDYNGTGIPVSYYSKVCLEMFSSTRLTACIDNVLIEKNSNMYKEELNPDKQPALNVDAPDKNEVIFDFENQNVGEDSPYGWTITDDYSTVAVKNSGNNKYLSVIGSSASTINVPITIRTKDANAFKFETDFTVNSIDDNSKIEVMFRDSGVMNRAIIRFWLIPVTENGETYLGVYEATSGIMGSRLDVRISIGNKIKLRIDYYESQAIALVYIDDNLVASSSAIESYAKRSSAGKVEITNFGTASIDIELDNVIAEKNISSFDSAVEPEIESIIHRFESGIVEGASLSNAAIVSNDNNKVVKFSNGGTLILPINKRSVINGAFIINATLNFSNHADQISAMTISVKDEEGETILSYSIKVKNNNLQIYEVTQNKSYDTPIASFNISNSFVFKLEYYQKQDVAHLFVDDICVAVTSITYSSNSGLLEAEHVYFDAILGGDNITIDNVVFESYNKIFLHAAADGDNPDDSEVVIDFEKSTTGNIPKQITSELKTSSAALRIKELIRNHSATKVIAFETSAGGQDKMIFAPSDFTSNDKVVVFESDMYFDVSSGEATYAIYLTNKSNKDSYLLQIGFTADGDLLLRDLTGESSTNVPGRIFGAKVSYDVHQNEWFKIRIEYYSGDHDSVRIKTYINDTLIYVSKGYYGRSTTVYGTSPIGDINRVIVASYAATSGVVYVDNMSLTKQALTLVDDPLTYIPAEPEVDLPNEEDDAEILTFESSVTGNLPSAITKSLSSTGASLSIEEVVRNGEKTKVMLLSSNNDFVDTIYIDKTKTLSNYNSITFTAKICFSECNKGSAYFCFVNGSNILYRIVFVLSEDGTISLNDYYDGNKSIDAAKANTGVDGRKWFEVNLSLYSVNGACKLLVKIDDNYQIVSESPAFKLTDPAKTTNFRFEVAKTTEAIVLLDDICLAESVIEIPTDPESHEHVYSSDWSYDENEHWHSAICFESSECLEAVKDLAVHDWNGLGLCECGNVKKSDSESKLDYTFDDGSVPSGITSVLKSEGSTITVTSDPLNGTSNQVLKFDTNAGGEDMIIIPFIGTEDNATKVVFETKYYVDATVNGTQTFEYMKGSTRVGYVALSMKSDGTISVSDYANSTNSFSSKTIDIGEAKWVNIKLVSYKNANNAFCTEIWIDNEFIVTSNHTSWVNTTVDSITGVRFSALKALDADIYFDDIKFSKTVEESEGLYNYNDGIIPNGITATLKSEGASVSITYAPLIDESNKVLKFDTNAGAEDMMSIAPTVVQDNATKIIFETEYYVDVTTDGTQAFDFIKGTTQAGCILLTMKSDGKFTVSDYANGINSFSSKTLDFGEPQWVTIKLVGYQNSDNSFCTEIWINDEFIITSTNTSWANTTVDGITSVRFRALKALDADVYFDNTKLSKVVE